LAKPSNVKAGLSRPNPISSTAIALSVPTGTPTQAPGRLRASEWFASTLSEDSPISCRL
jgi:hypothetical protein